MDHSYQEIRKRVLKPDEGVKPVYARLVTHTVSTWLCWLFQKGSFKPNTLSFLSLVAACLALPFFLRMTPVAVLVGSLWIELYYILDAMDGQWARLKQAKSLTGAFFDYLINYAIQPPLLFAIAWGVYIKTGNPGILVLGFTSAFATIWVLMIWNMRASILLSHLSHLNQAPAKAGPTSPKARRDKTRDTLRNFFGWLHKSMVFPWFMNVLSITSLVAWLVFIVSGNHLFCVQAFTIFLAYYGLVSPLVAVAITAKWILTGQIDRSEELPSS